MGQTPNWFERIYNKQMGRERGLGSIRFYTHTHTHTHTQALDKKRRGPRVEVVERRWDAFVGKGMIMS